MLIFLDKKLAFLAVPKAGSTSYEAALRRHCSIEARRPTNARHCTARRWDREWAPFIRNSFGKEIELMAIIREPRARLGSWYRYRLGQDRNHPSRHLTFEEFVRASLADKPPPEAQIGSQDVFASGADGNIRIDHLFCFENREPLDAFLRDRFGEEIEIGHRNASQDADLTLSKETAERLAHARSSEFALHQKVSLKGYLHTPQSTAR